MVKYLIKQFLMLNNCLCQDLNPIESHSFIYLFIFWLSWISVEALRIFFCFFFFFFFKLLHVGSSSLRGIESWPLHWKCGVLTTGPQGSPKSHS